MSPRSVSLAPSTAAPLLHWGILGDSGTANGWLIAAPTLCSPNLSNVNVEGYSTHVVPAGTKLKNLRVRLANSVSNQNHTYTVRCNGVDTTITCVVTAGARAAGDTTHTFTCPDSGDGNAYISLAKAAAAADGVNAFYMTRASLEFYISSTLP